MPVSDLRALSAGLPHHIAAPILSLTKPNGSLTWIPVAIRRSNVRNVSSDVCESEEGANSVAQVLIKTERKTYWWMVVRLAHRRWRQSRRNVCAVVALPESGDVRRRQTKLTNILPVPCAQ